MAGKTSPAALESEVAAARAAQAELQRRVEMFEKIAEAAGPALGGPEPTESAQRVPVPDVPPSLLAAAWKPRQNGDAVRFAAAGWSPA